MDRDEWLILLFTFTMGVVAGAFVYINGFKPTFMPGEGVRSQERDAQDFQIVGRAYGGQQRMNFTHPQFRVTKNGAYRYIPGGSDATRAPVDGALPPALYTELRRAVMRADLGALSGTPPSGKVCRVAEGGVDYNYRITVAEVTYELDTCATALSYEHPLAAILARTWRELAAGEGAGDTPRPATTFDVSIIDYLDRFFPLRNPEASL